MSLARVLFCLVIPKDITQCIFMTSQITGILSSVNMLLLVKAFALNYCMHMKWKGITFNFTAEHTY